jgi:hypothetical protein
MNKKILLLTLLFTLTGLFLFLFQLFSSQPLAPSPLPTPTPFNPFPYQLPTIKSKPAYVLVLVGDSMTGALGPNAEQLRQKLLGYYPEKDFVSLNYGFGGQNILTLEKRLTQSTSFQGNSFPPILEQKFDLIIIESFAYNPLSHLPLEEGLEKQTQALDQAVKKFIQTHPGSALVFLATIAPNQKMFAQGIHELSPEKRAQWAQERITYLENHIQYAQARQIPLINVYQKSLAPDGDADLKYINPDNYLHPSHEGIDLISHSIAEFIFENKIFPSE